jgi:hypothetical protein
MDDSSSAKLKRMRYLDRAHCVKEARMFLHACQPAVIACVLEIAEPLIANADGMREWVKWWRLRQSFEKLKMLIGKRGSKGTLLQ